MTGSTTTFGINGANDITYGLYTIHATGSGRDNVMCYMLGRVTGTITLSPKIQWVAGAITYTATTTNTKSNATSFTSTVYADNQSANHGWGTFSYSASGYGSTTKTLESDF